jgi:hypothetical protein
MKKPIRQQTYTFSEICELYLRDSPCLSFEHNNITGVIQNSHLNQEQLLSSVPLMADSKWVYIRETFEWISVFKFSSENTILITDIADLEEHKLEKKYFDKVCWWATPKGYPRPQYE